MKTDSKLEKVLQELNYNFADFNLDNFFDQVSRKKSCDIIPLAWEGMPLGMFGAWLKNDSTQTIYLLYRCDVPIIHQTHIQLHELAHFLLGHPAPSVDEHLVLGIINGEIDPPFFKNILPALRSQKSGPTETEAELLADLIQQRIIHYAGISKLTENVSNIEKFNNFLKGLHLL